MKGRSFGREADQCAEPAEIVFVRNATEAINLRRLLVGPPQHRPRRLHRPDRDGAPCQPRAVAAPGPEKDGDLEFVPISDDGLLRLEVFEVLLH